MKEFIRDLDASPRLRAIRYQRPAEGHPEIIRLFQIAPPPVPV
jgi:hypothetical protein